MPLECYDFVFRKVIWPLPLRRGGWVGFRLTAKLPLSETKSNFRRSLNICITFVKIETLLLKIFFRAKGLFVVYYCLRFYLQQPSLVNSQAAWVLSMKFSIHNLFWPTPNSLDLHHPRNSSHFWAVPKFYGLTLTTNPRHLRHPRFLGDSL